MTEGTDAARSGRGETLPVELRILELFCSARLATLGPTDVERLTGVSKGTASGRLKALAAANYLASAGTGRYRPGGRMFELAIGYLGMVLHQLDEVDAIVRANLLVVRGSAEAIITAFQGTAGQMERPEPAEPEPEAEA